MCIQPSMTATPAQFGVEPIFAGTQQVGTVQHGGNTVCHGQFLGKTDFIERSADGSIFERGVMITPGPRDGTWTTPPRHW